MARRTGKVKTMTVVVPRHGTPAASRGLVKAVAAEIKKENRVFQEQDHVSATELQGLEDASNWNGLLLNARGERGPQWDVTSQMHHVDFGSEEFFNPQLLLDEPILPAAESDVTRETAPQREVNMAMNTSPTQAYPQHNGQEGMRSLGHPGPAGYPSYGQTMNDSYPRGGLGGENMGGNPMYLQHSQPSMHARMGPEMPGGGSMVPPHQQHMYSRPAPGMDMSRQQPQQHHAAPISGLPYGNHAGHPGHGHGMDPGAMGMGGGYGGQLPNTYGHTPGGMQQGGPSYPRGGPGPGGSYGGMYPS